MQFLFITLKIISMETATLTKSNGKAAMAHLNPEHILQIGMGFWASKTLLAAIKFNLFTVLGSGPLKAGDIRKKLGLHERSLYDFLDALVSLGYLKREGIYETAVYSN